MCVKICLNVLVINLKVVPNLKLINLLNCLKSTKIAKKN